MTQPTHSMRTAFGEALVMLGKEQQNVVVLCADLSSSTSTALFQQAFPDRFFEMGVAEQNMMGVAAGLALEGKIPFVTSYAVFSPGLNWDQLRISVCYQQANVKIVSTHAGITVGEDGATHQALEDIAITRCLPNMTVLVPRDAQETQEIVRAAAEILGPVYVRLPRPATSYIPSPTPFELGKIQILREGSDVSIIGCGPLLYEALRAADMLAEEGVSAEVINCSTIKPLDVEGILKSVRKTHRVITVEEHQVAGGLGSAIAELLAEHEPLPIHMVGVRDSFGESGTPEELMEKYELTAEFIKRKWRKNFN